jgi:hypothetical protein
MRLRRDANQGPPVPGSSHRLANIRSVTLGEGLRTGTASPATERAAPLTAQLPPVLRARVLIPASVVLAIASLALTRSPTFDVWAWLVWGREIGHLQLHTSGGPQFKPLPVAVTTLGSMFGDGAVPIWMAVARAAGLLAVGGAARLAWRASGPLAAAIAAGSVLTIQLFSDYMLAFGMSEPMLAAFALWAVDRHCDGKRTSVYVLLFGACLLRVEAWPFLLGYAILTDRRREVHRALLVTLLVLVPAAWFLPEWWGSGDPFRMGDGLIVAGDPGSYDHPGAAVLSSAFDDLLSWVWVGALIGVVWAAWVRHRLLLNLTWIGALWLAIVAVMAEAGVSTGVARYLIVTHVIACVLAGVGWTVVLRAAWTRLGEVSRAARVVAPVVVLALAVPSALTLDGWLRDGVAGIRHQEAVYDASAKAVARAGGPAVLNRCGKYTWTRDYRGTQVAWLVHRPLPDVVSLAVPQAAENFKGTMVQIVDRPGDPLLPQPFPFLTYHEVGRATADGVPTVVLSPC